MLKPNMKMKHEHTDEVSWQNDRLTRVYPVFRCLPDKVSANLVRGGLRSTAGAFLTLPDGFIRGGQSDDGRFKVILVELSCVQTFDEHRFRLEHSVLVMFLEDLQGGYHRCFIHSHTSHVTTGTLTVAV